jgi:hypothetical protein
LLRYVLKIRQSFDLIIVNNEKLDNLKKDSWVFILKADHTKSQLSQGFNPLGFTQRVAMNKLLFCFFRFCAESQVIGIQPNSLNY